MTHLSTISSEEAEYRTSFRSALTNAIKWHGALFN